VDVSRDDEFVVLVSSRVLQNIQKVSHRGRHFMYVRLLKQGLLFPLSLLEFGILNHQVFVFIVYKERKNVVSFSLLDYFYLLVLRGVPILFTLPERLSGVLIDEGAGDILALLLNS
jgi:hypothetical protein